MSTPSIASMKKTHSPYTTTKTHSKVDIGKTHEIKHERHHTHEKKDDDFFIIGTLPEEYG